MQSRCRQLNGATPIICLSNKSWMMCVGDSRRSRCTASTSVRRTSVRTAIAKYCTPGRSTVCRRSASSRRRWSDGTRRVFRCTRIHLLEDSPLSMRRRSLCQKRRPATSSSSLSLHQSPRYERVRWCGAVLFFSPFSICYAAYEMS